MKLLIEVDVYDHDNDALRSTDPMDYALCLRYEDAAYDCDMPGQMALSSARWVDPEPTDEEKRQARLNALDEYLEELEAKLGPPDPQEVERFRKLLRGD